MWCENTHGNADIAARWCHAGPLNSSILKSCQVCDGLAKWLIMLEFMDLRKLRVAWSYNIGLGKYCGKILRIFPLYPGSTKQ